MKIDMLLLPQSASPALPTATQRAAATTMAIAKLLRLVHGGSIHELIDLDLKFPEYRSYADIG